MKPSFLIEAWVFYYLELLQILGLLLLFCSLLKRAYNFIFYFQKE